MLVLSAAPAYSWSLMDTLLGVCRLRAPFKWPTSTHTLIIALPRTCHQSICMSVWRAIMKAVCTCVRPRARPGTADALMMLISRTADVRIAASDPPQESAWTSNSFIVVKSICLLCVGSLGWQDASLTCVWLNSHTGVNQGPCSLCHTNNCWLLCQLFKPSFAL